MVEILLKEVSECICFDFGGAVNRTERGVFTVLEFDIVRIRSSSTLCLTLTSEYNRIPLY